MVTQHAEKIMENEKGATRPPIVVVLGHVDHGKSSLLEAIREDFRITSRESGGITQHIGAYQVEIPQETKSRASETSRGTLRQDQVSDSEAFAAMSSGRMVAQARGGDTASTGRSITFIDTPGHELFSAMRSRGARVADIAVLVVAADESVKPQTIEAIAQIKKAGIPMVVAINKIDKPEANVQRVYQELAQHDVMVEAYGGTVPSQTTSAVTKQGMKELLELILLVAELQDIRADRAKPAEGVVVESYMDSKRGPMVTILAQNGTVKIGDYIGTDTAGGKIRMLEDFQGNRIQQVLPSMPAVILGFSQAPRVGEQFRVFPDEASQQAAIGKEKPEEKTHIVMPDSASKTINVIVKADVAGSLEVLEDVLKSLPQEQATIQIIEAGVGEVLENDVKLARSTNASIFSFRAKVSTAASRLAEKENIPILKFNVIYELIQGVKELAEQSLEAEETRKDLGSLLVLAVFLADKKKQVIGGKVIEGEARKGLRAEVVRGEQIVGQGRIANVQRDKKDVPAATKGQECGLIFEGAERVQPEDRLLFFIEKPSSS